MQSTHFLEKGRDERTHERSNLRIVLGNKRANTEQWKDTYPIIHYCTSTTNFCFFMWCSFPTVGCVAYPKRGPLGAARTDFYRSSAVASVKILNVDSRDSQSYVCT